MFSFTDIDLTINSQASEKNSTDSHRIPITSGGTLPFCESESCDKKCNTGLTPVRYWKRCNCDPPCLFLGDCCHDYLFHCDNDSTHLHTQSQSMIRQGELPLRFHGNTCCETFRIFYGKRGRPYSSVALKMVCKCPPDSPSKSQHLCENNMHGSQPHPIPFFWKNAIFANIHCALCYGMPIVEVKPVNFTFQCIDKIPYDNLTLTSLLHLTNTGQCFLVLLPFTDDLQLARYSDGCDTTLASIIAPPKCEDSRFLQECFSYSAPRRAYHLWPNMSRTSVRNMPEDRSHKNGACAMCALPTLPMEIVCGQFIIRKSRPNIKPIHKLAWFFDFTGMYRIPRHEIIYCSNDSYVYSETLQKCIERICQPGYQLSHGLCVTSLPLIQPFMDRISPAILVFTQNASAVRALLLSFGMNYVDAYEHCPMDTFALYLNILIDFFLPPTDASCIVGWYEPIEFFYMYNRMIKSHTMYEEIAASETILVILLNHDPTLSVSCPNNYFPVAIPCVSSLFDHDGSLILRSESGAEFRSSDEPVIFGLFINKTFSHLLHTYTNINWAIICKTSAGMMNKPSSCNADEEGNVTVKDMNISTSCIVDITSCPKTRLNSTFYTISSSGQLLIGTLSIPSNQYLNLSTGDVLICVMSLKKLTSILPKAQKSPLEIVMVISYSISLGCLAFTFFVYIRFTSLRTLPGQMIMSLIFSMFSSQLTYLVAYFQIVLGSPFACWVLAVTQHYFWISSFCWMSVISRNIYKCLSSIMHNVEFTFSHSLFRIYNVVGWFLPTLPIIVCLTLTNLFLSNIGYEIEILCWFANKESLLWFFILPIFLSIIWNVAHFVGCIYCIRQLAVTAEQAGVNSDPKGRFWVCLRMSSWLGITWLLGLLPSFIDYQEIWYICVIATALQGVQIFVTFGCSTAVRRLMFGNTRQTAGSSTR